jgi:hypothetical protein
VLVTNSAGGKKAEVAGSIPLIQIPVQRKELKGANLIGPYNSSPVENNRPLPSSLIRMRKNRTISMQKKICG